MAASDDSTHTLQLLAEHVTVLEEDAAHTLLAALKDKNALFATLDGTPNAHLVVFDLTRIGAVSQHSGDTRYRLAAAALPRALPTLIGKPVYVTAGMTGHREPGRQGKAIGVFLGADPIPQADGTVVVRSVAALWDGDFKSDVQRIRAQRAELGASYEIVYQAQHATRSGYVVDIDDYMFTGGAILLRRAAAHPDTRVLIAGRAEDEWALGTRLHFDERPPAGWEPEGPLDAAGAGLYVRAETLTSKERNALKSSDFAIPDERRFPIHDEAHRKNAWARVENADLSDAEKAAVRDKIIARAKSAGDAWAKDYRKLGTRWVKTKQGGRVMPKYAPIPEEFEPVVEAHLAAAIGSATRESLARAERAEQALAQLTDEKKRTLEQCATAQATITTLTNEKNELVAAHTKLQAEHTAVTTELQAKAKAEAVEATWKVLADKHHLPDKLKAQKLPLIEKLAAKEALTVEEFESLIAGGTPKPPTGPASPTQAPPVPLYAGATDGAQPSPWDADTIAKFWPASVRMSRLQGAKQAR